MSLYCEFRRRLVGAGLLALGLGGCAGFWDEVTSRDFHVKNMFHKPTPMEVLRDSSDGAKRGWALGELKEPLRNGGTQEDQESYIKLLEAAALRDREPLCRLGAIRALSDYKDPRASKILADAYLAKPAFSPELTSRIRQQALTGLVNTTDPEAKALLIRVARQPNAGPDSSYADRQQTIDEKLTALRGLAKFKDTETVDALVVVLETEKDIALRDRAHESLKTITGKEYAADGKTWREYAGTGRVKDDLAQQKPFMALPNFLKAEEKPVQPASSTQPLEELPEAGQKRSGFFERLFRSGEKKKDE